MFLRPEDLRTLFACAELYSKNLLNHEVAFIFDDPPKVLETQFKAENFLHLTGVRRIKTEDFLRLPGVNPNDEPPRAETFLTSFLDKTFNANLWDFSGSWFRVKLKILPHIMAVKTLASDVGPFNTSYGVRLKTDKIIGNGLNKSCLGLRSAGRYYVPNTALREKIQKVTLRQHPITLIADRTLGQKYKAIRGKPDLLALPYSFLREMDFSNIPVIAAQDGKSYVGRIVSNRGNDCYQVTLQGLVKHSLSLLDTRPQEDTITWIGYCKNKGYTRLAKPQEVQLFKDRKTTPQLSR